MPRYEYRCNEEDCLREWSVIKPLRAWDEGWDGTEKCPNCGRREEQVYLNLRRIPDINPFGFHVANLEKTDFGTQREYDNYLAANQLSEREPRFSK